MSRRNSDAGRKMLLGLVVAVLVVSLAGTWLVLQTGFESPTRTQQGVVNFVRTPGIVPLGSQPVVQTKFGNDAGEVSFVKVN